MTVSRTTAERSQASSSGKPWLCRGFGFVLSALAIAFWTYLFGHPLIEGPIAGSDSAYALALISWIDRWFPELPAWYPLQGAGSSGIIQYPFASQYFVVLLSRLAGLTLTESFRFTQIGVVIATALGIYVLAWRKVRSQTAGLIAGLAYPISAATWKWLAAIGLFAQSASLALFAPTFMLFENYAIRSRSKPGSASVRRQRMVLGASSLAFGILLVTHIITAAVFGMTILVYSILVALFEQRGARTKAAISNCRRALSGLVLGLSLASLWTIPFFHVNSVVNREGPVAEFSLEQLQYVNIAEVIGLEAPSADASLYAVTFASPLIILAAAGLLLSINRDRSAFALGVLSVLFVFFTALPGISQEIVQPFHRLWANLYGRATIPAMIFLPVVAGYGALELSRHLIRGASVALGRRQLGEPAANQRKSYLDLFGRLLVSPVAMAIAIGAFLFLRHPPSGYGDYPGYGLPLDEAWWPFRFDEGLVSMRNWPTFRMNDSPWPNGGEEAQELAATLELTAEDRLHLSPTFGGLVEAFPIYTEASIIGMYYYQGMLNSPMNGYVSETYWNANYGTQHEIDEFARWMGIEYVVMNELVDPVADFQTENWRPVPLTPSERLGNVSVSRFNEPTGLASVLKGPEVLVVGGYENGLYQQILRLFNSGLVEYGHATIVEGSHNIDDYSLEHLSGFEVVFLHGYGYHDRERAWQLLNDYVRQGGALYAETGWQYWVPDWETESAPLPLPVSDLEWTHISADDQLRLDPDQTWSSVDVSRFAPMLWEGQPWGVSSSSRGLASWATPVLRASEKPLVAAGHYGDGRVVWSGMNLVGHVIAFENAEERELLQRLIFWLLGDVGTETLEQPTVERNHPDRVNVVIRGPIEEGTNLLWRENHAPGWRATAELNATRIELPVYRAGPGMMLMQLPASGAEKVSITMEYSIEGYRLVGRVASAAAALLLLGAALFPGRNSLRSDTPLRSAEKNSTHLFGDLADSSIVTVEIPQPYPD